MFCIGNNSNRSMRWWRSADIGSPTFAEAIDNHHAVELFILRKLKPEWENLTRAQSDQMVSGYLLRMNEHQGSGGLSGAIKQAIRRDVTYSDPYENIGALRQVYIGEGYDNLWDVTKLWLRENGFPDTPN